MKSISIVFPVHNEIENLEKLLFDWSDTLNNNKIDYEFVLVEDGSNDGTKELIKELEKKYKIINLSQDAKRGYSKAVVDGILASKKKFILCTDSDNQIKVDSLIDTIHSLPNENEFIIGFRNPRKDPMNRIIYSKLFKIFHDLLFRSKLKDPSCPFVIGLKSTFNKLSKENLIKMKEGFWWGFVANCLKKNLKFIEVPIKHFPRTKGEGGYKLKDMMGIIIRNVIGLIKIRISNT